MPEMLTAILIGVVLALLVLAVFFGCLYKTEFIRRHLLQIPEFPPGAGPKSDYIYWHSRKVERNELMSETPVKKAYIEIYPRRTKDPKRRFGIRVIALNGEILPDDYRSERAAFRGAEDFQRNVTQAVIVKKVKGHYVIIRSSVIRHADGGASLS
jgi:hypothetical protein